MGNPSQAISVREAAKLQPANISQVTAGRPFQRMRLTTGEMFINQKGIGAVTEGEALAREDQTAAAMCIFTVELHPSFSARMPFQLGM